MKRLILIVLLGFLLPLNVLAQEPPSESELETFTSRDGLLSYDFPAGWAAVELPQYYLLASSEEVLEAEMVENEQVQVYILAIINILFIA